MTSFASIGAFVRHMEVLLATMPQADHRALDKSSKLLLDEVKSIPGEYQPGWKPLAAETVARKKTGDSPLLETGAMRESYGRKIESHERAYVGTDDKKAVIHETGSSRTPPRPVLSTAAMRKEAEIHKITGNTIYRHLAGLPETLGDNSD